MIYSAINICHTCQTVDSAGQDHDLRANPARVILETGQRFRPERSQGGLSQPSITELVFANAEETDARSWSSAWVVIGLAR